MRVGAPMRDLVAEVHREEPGGEGCGPAPARERGSGGVSDRRGGGRRCQLLRGGREVGDVGVVLQVLDRGQPSPAELVHEEAVQAVLRRRPGRGPDQNGGPPGLNDLHPFRIADPRGACRRFSWRWSRWSSWWRPLAPRTDLTREENRFRGGAGASCAGRSRSAIGRRLEPVGAENPIHPGRCD